jgi:hypothetical protein
VYSDGTKTAHISDVRIHDNLIYNLRGNAININNQSTGEIKIYNNIIYNCGQGPDFRDGMSNYAGVLIGGNNNATVYIYNNTIYNCGYPLHANNSGLIHVQSSFKGVLYVRNNIFYANGNKQQSYYLGVPQKNGRYHNLFFGYGKAPQWDIASIHKDPQFVNAQGGDFHLQSVSPAIDAGTNDVSALISSDFDGNIRPEGTGFDLGVYEYVKM